MRPRHFLLVLGLILPPTYLVACVGSDPSPTETPPSADAAPDTSVGETGSDAAEVDAGPDCSRPRATIGVFDPTSGGFTFFLTSGATRQLPAGAPSTAKPIAGHWTGAADDVGWFDPPTQMFTLVIAGASPRTFGFGASAEVPVAGDWNGDGLSSVGVFFSPDTTTILTNASMGTPMADYNFTFGAEDAGARPLAGDWDGDGKSGFGVFYPGTGHFDLKDTLGPGAADHSIDTTHLGAGVWPVAADWSGCGRATVGVFDQSARKFFLLEANQTGAKETIYDAPNLDGLLPVAGAWSP